MLTSDPGPLRALFGAPGLHHFANLAPWTDLLFGTYHVPPGDESWPLGNPGEPPRGYFAHLVSPFRRTARPPRGVGSSCGALSRWRTGGSRLPPPRAEA